MTKIKAPVPKIWEKPSFINIRLGFEITMYVNTKV
ncbi:MAG: pyrroloquinoline quinone precursor peptide PqqA [Chitinophagaceae bacterium]|nr:pyrroloquinoline quinone precursor peptide PqqA [Oligoflexus sp.]